MNMKIKAVNTLILGLLVCFSCGELDEESYTITFSFYDDAQGWLADFADYPAGEEVFYELSAGWAHLPSPLETTKGSFRISGNNHSDDLFMFIKRKVDGLRKNTRYHVTLEIEMASNAPTNAIGIGGAPGEGVTLKVGAVMYYPDKLLGDDDFYSINLDKGNQTSSGEDMFAIGHIGVSDTTTVYSFIKRNNNAVPIEITTDEEGAFWVVIGTDSGFEGITTLYYNNIKLVVSKA